MNRFFSTFLRLLACASLSALFVGCLDENGNSSTGQTPTSPAPIIVNTISPCESDKVTLKNGSTTTEFATIQLAVNAAQNGQVVNIPRGDWKELVSIVSKENVEISSQCFPTVYGFSISKSKDLKIKGLHVTGLPTGSAGFELAGGSDGNTNIEISNNEISGIANDYNGINVQSQNSVKIIKNYIHDNKQNGISFADSNKGGSHLIEQNQISYNGKNGIVVPKKQDVLIKGNRITYNGQLSTSTDVDNGYGIRRNGAGPHHPDDITLIDNAILYNNGHKNNKSSRDISFFESIFDSGDVRNMTTEGYEGSGSVVFLDTVAPKFLSFTEDHVVTKYNQFYLQGLVDDVSKVSTDIYLNGVKIYSTQSNAVNLVATLAEGVNTFRFKATDAAGNSTDQVILSDIRYDTTPAILTQISPLASAKIYTNHFPFNFETFGSSNEPLSSVTVNGNTGLLDLEKKHFNGVIQAEEVGSISIDYVALDLIGNESTFSVDVDVVFDDVPPILATDVLPKTRTKDTTYPVSVSVRDLTSTWTEIWMNGTKVFGTAAIDFTFNVPLNLEGENTIEVRAQDAAGNLAQSFTDKIIRDTTPPVLSFVTPLNDGFVSGVRFKVNVSSNEPLTAAKLNERVISVTDPISSYEIFYSVSDAGEVTLNAQATDLVGNIGTASIKVIALMNGLNKSLLGVHLDETTGKLIVTGAVGTVRSGLTVKVAGGFFDTQEVIASNRGSFQVAMDPYNQYSVSVYDPELADTFSATVTFGQDSNIILSGTVRDTDDQPLVGVKVSIANTTLITETDSYGVFTFSRSQFPGTNILGDQQLLVDGTTAIAADIGTARKFSKSSVAITIGIRQSNVLQTPIYLAPTYLDGSATTISKAAGGEVNDIHAPGVELSIPASAASFPDGSSAALISMQTIPVDRATVAAIPEARPKTVVALEPSGTTFSQPVEVTLPNVNEFPPQTEMLLMLMNSKTGKWEVGGAATVSESGSSVVTKPGLGIRHFSLVYATVAGPVVRQVGSQDRPGASALDGALSSQINLPSFKVFGQSITPSLFYKSSWAKPSAVVTNLFDIPNQKMDLTVEKKSGAQVTSYQADITSCTWPFTSTSIWCHKDKKTFYNNIQYEINYSGVTSEIQPEKVEAYLRTANITTPTQTFSNIPHMANITFGLELINNTTTGEYLPSGIYPYQAHYDVHYKELIMGTSQTTVWDSSMDAKVQSPESFKQENKGVFTNDLTDSIFVQNYRNSEAGTGWKVGGYQKIANPNGNKVMVEEADGSISSYSVGNSISTILDLTAQGGDANKGVALNTWPVIAFGSADGKKIYKAAYSNGISKSEFATQYNLSGMVAGFDYYNYVTQTFRTERYCKKRILTACVSFGTRTIVTDNPNSYCSQHAANFAIGSNPTQMVILPDGQVIGTDSYRHSVFQANSGGTQLVLGAVQSPTSFSNFYAKTTDTNQTSIQTYCQDSSGMACSTQTGSINTYSSYNACPTQGPISTGLVPVKGDSIVNESQSLNTPMGIVPGFYPNTVIVVDTGNHKVREFNTITQQSRIIAGNGQTTDSGDGGSATSAGIFHPRGAAYDRNGNLYISSENGRIRKVDPNGIITTLAGDPINGVLSNEAPAVQMLFNKPYGLVVDNQRAYLYVADTGHNRVVRIDLFSETASTVAGNGQTGFSGDGMPALEASISAPTLLGLDTDGNLLILDSGNNKVRRVIFQTASLGSLVFNPTSEDNSRLIRKEDSTWERDYREGLKVFFDQTGKQYAAQDRLGNTTQYLYDSQNRLTTMNFSNGTQVLYNYSGDKLDFITDPAGRVTYFDYDWSGTLKKVRFPDNSEKLFAYDSKGLMLSETNQRGLATNYQYNVYGRLARAVDPTGASLYIRDADSTNLSLQSTSTAPQSPGYDEHQLNSTIADPNQNTTQIVKDFDGYIYSIKDALGRATTLKRDLKGRVIQTIFPDGSVENKNYNSLGDLILTNDVGTGITEEFSYDNWGHQIAMKDGNGFISQQVYDANNGLLLTETSPSGRSIQYSYYSNGLLKSKSSSLGSSQTLTQTYEYDSKGNLSKQINSDGKFTTFTVDQAGNVTSSTSDSSTTYYQYNVFNRLRKVISPKGEATEYAYLASGELSQIKDPSGKLTSFEYDDRGKLTKKTDSSGAIYQFSYDPSGNLVTEMDPSNNLKTYGYDQLNQMIQAQFPDDLITYAYDVKGKVIQAKNSVSQVDYRRDSKSRITSTITRGQGASLSYPIIELINTYDSNSNRTSLSTSVGSLNYQYDLNNQMTGLQNSWGDQFGFSYDPAGRLTQITRPGSQSNFSYGASEILQSITHQANGTTKSLFEYQYDLRNMPTQKRTISSTINYIYDLNGQLTGSTPSNGAAETFAYDGLGNRTSDANGTYQYDANNQQLTEDWQYHYTYDANGNLSLKVPKNLTAKAYKYSYSSKNQLVLVEILENPLSDVVKSIRYTYDVMGRRIQKSVWDRDNQSDPKKSYTRKYVYDGDNVFLEYNSDNQLLARYTFGQNSPDDILGADIQAQGVIAGLAQTEGKVYYLKDALGTVGEIISSDGNIVQRYEYSSFGKITSIKDGADADISASPAISTSYTFTGREWDQEADLYYYRARYYDPNLGRFLQKDPDPGKAESPISVINAYLYVGNQPTIATDPKGKFAFLAAFLWTALYSGAVSAIQASIQTNNGHNGSWWDAFSKNFAVNLAVSSIGLFSAAWQAGFSNANFQLGWGGVFNTTKISRGFSVGFFQATGGGSANLVHEAGHSINFALLGLSWGPNMRIEDRLVSTGIFYGAHIIGSVGGRYNPVTYITEGGADIWGWDFTQVRNYTRPDYPIGY